MLTNTPPLLANGSNIINPPHPPPPVPVPGGGIWTSSPSPGPPPTTSTLPGGRLKNYGNGTSIKSVNRHDGIPPPPPLHNHHSNGHQSSTGGQTPLQGEVGSYNGGIRPVNDVTKTTAAANTSNGKMKNQSSNQIFFFFFSKRIATKM